MENSAYPVGTVLYIINVYRTLLCIEAIGTEDIQTQWEFLDSNGEPDYEFRKGFALNEDYSSENTVERTKPIWRITVTNKNQKYLSHKALWVCVELPKEQEN